MPTPPETDLLYRDLHEAVERLADAVADEPRMADAIRRFGRALPEPTAVRALPPRPPRVRPVRDLLYAALDRGALDSRRFDRLMLAENRAGRAAVRRGLRPHG